MYDLFHLMISVFIKGMVVESYLIVGGGGGCSLKKALLVL